MVVGLCTLVTCGAGMSASGTGLARISSTGAGASDVRPGSEEPAWCGSSPSRDPPRTAAMERLADTDSMALERSASCLERNCDAGDMPSQPIPHLKQG